MTLDHLVLLAAIGLSGGPVATTPDSDPGPTPDPGGRTYYETATVEARPLDEATAAVTVIDRAAIEASGAATAAELLRSVPGLYVAGSGTRGGFATASIRGGDPNFTLVLLDGVPLNDITDPVGGAFNLESLPLAAVERVEIVRGPLSSFYGSTGLAGAVQIVTRRGPEGERTGDRQPDAAPAWSAAVEAGDASLLRGVATASGRHAGRGGYFVAASWDEESERIAGEGFEQANLHANLDLELGAAALRLSSRWSRWQADDYPEASGGPLFGTGALRRSDHREASLAAELVAGRHRLELGHYRHRLDRESPGVFPLVPPSVEETLYRRSRAGWQASLVARSRFELAAGADLTEERGENDSVLILPPFLGGAVSGDYAVSRTTGGAFVELVSRRGPALFELGARLDAAEGTSPELSPRLGVSLHPGNGPTRWRASVGRAFKLPSFFALASPPALGGNPALEPETVVTAELGFERRFTADLSAGLTAFASRYDDLVDFDFATFTHLNRSQVDARGGELTLAWEPRPRLSLAAATTWQEVENRDTGAPLRNRPEWAGSVRLTGRPLPELVLAADLYAVSSRRDEQIPVPELTTAPGYELVGLTARWRLAAGFELTGRVENLLDQEHQTFIGFPGAGRSWRIGLRYRAASGSGS